MKWEGLSYYKNKILYGGVGEPLVVRYGDSSTPTASEDYESMNKFYRFFRQDEMVRRCIVVNAYFSTMTAGFETELEAVDPKGDLSKEQKDAICKKYSYVKEYVDKMNKQVNMDKFLFVSQVKRSIYGAAGWEIVYKLDAETPDWLLSLNSTRLSPKVNKKWQLIGFRWDKSIKWKNPADILYFPNLQLENDWLGLSDIEPVLDACLARHDLLRVDIPEIAHRLWAPYVLLQADTSRLATKELKQTFLQELLDAAKSGKSAAFNQEVTATVVNMSINLVGLVALLDKLEEAIMRQFGTPRFLLGKPIENRATAYAELEAYVQGIIANIQLYFKRELERQWYDRLTKLILKKNGVQEVLPVVVKHVWNPIRTMDVYAMAAAVTNLYQTGLGILADYPDIAFDMMGWDKEKLREKQEADKQRLQDMLNRESTTT